MRRGAPEAFGFARGAPRPALGRALRFACVGGELWELPDRALAARLSELGKNGVGGFVECGEDDGRFWVVRAESGTSLADWIGQRPSVSWREALTMVLSLARALEACESAGLFAGAIPPSALSVRGETICVRADALVHALVGASSPEIDGSASARWMPPEQARGAPWDNAANRYVLGLLLYRMIAGEHAFAAKGLRLGLDEQASRGAPPFADAIASTLPPGLQSACLRLLHPDPRERPRSAATIRELLTPFSHEPRAPAPQHAPLAASPELPPAFLFPTRRKRRGWRGVLSAAAVIVGVSIGASLLAFIGEKKARGGVAERPLLSAATTRANDCASCHPRQVGEWQRSIMAHSVKSPLFQSLEMLIEEQVGRDFSCEHGAGILRNADPSTACRDRSSGLVVTGSGGELWCVNCHAPMDSLARNLPAWDAQSQFSRSRLPVRDLLPETAMEGIGCAFCHQAHGPVRPGNATTGRYEGNPFWTSTRTGERFPMRPEDARGVFGIANSGYFLEPNELVAFTPSETLAAGVHARPSPDAQRYLRSSEFCGACHDVRLFGSDGLRIAQGEHFKRLRNAYSEWAEWASSEERAGRIPATCQDCHMSRFPGNCVNGRAPPGLPSSLARACPPGTHFSPLPPGSYPDALSAADSSTFALASTHYLSGVDVPLAQELDERTIDDPSVDVHGIPLGARQRRDLLLGRTFRFELGQPAFSGAVLSIPIVIENVGAGHRVPAGFSQEREFWVHLRVTDAGGRVLYEVGRVDRNDEDLHDKTFLRVTTDLPLRDAAGRPIGLFGADVTDGPDAPRWSPPPELGGTEFRGLGLINMQNGFLRCVTCIGVIDAQGQCQPGPGQGLTRADRFDDGAFDLDTGICTSNLVGQSAFFETYLPVGALDASRGIVKGPDAIIDTRSAPPGVTRRYVYELPLGSAQRVRVEARLLFRAFPPFLIRAFAAYEAAQVRAGLRPSGPLVTDAMLERLEVVELIAARAEVR